MPHADRYEWERVVRRCRITQGQKLLAFILATYSDPDGSRVRPGLPRLTGVTGQSESTVKRHLRALRDLGLITVARRGGGRGGSGHTTEYQLAIPEDLLERVELLGPGEQPSESEAIQVTPQTDVDNSDSEAIQVTSESGDTAPIERSHSAEAERLGGQNERIGGHPGDLLPTHNYQPPKKTNPVVLSPGESRPRDGPPVDHRLRAAS